MQILTRTRLVQFPCASERLPVLLRPVVQTRAHTGTISKPATGSHTSLRLPEPGSIHRRLLLAGAVWLIMPNLPPLATRPAKADDAAAPVTYKTLDGFALPPDSYLGYEPTMKEPPKYSIEYPSSGWTVSIPSKTEKSTMGMDVRVKHAKAKGVEAFVVALSGPDYRGAQLASDPMKQLQAMATSDYELREAMSEARDIKTATRNIGGRKAYDYDFEGGDMHWLSTMTVDPKDGRGTMYALMVKAPMGRAFDANEAVLRHIAASFKPLA